MAEQGLARLKGLLGGGNSAAKVVPAPGSDGERRQALALLKDFEKSGLGWFWSTDAEGRVIYMTDQVAAALGSDPSGSLFHTLFTIDQEHENSSQRNLPLIFSSHKTFADLVVRTVGDSAETWWSISGRPQFEAGGAFTGYFGNGVDVTESRRSQLDASRLAQFDALTGLANRHRMAKRLSTTLTAYQTAKRSCAIMLLDLDRFKQVNDTLGHQAGDELLKQVASRLGAIVKDKTFEIGRLGGDEFQILLPDIDDRGRLGEIAKSVISMLSQPYQVDGSRCVIGVSVGIAIAPYDGIDSEELVRSADLALYAAKGGGRGQFRFYSSDLHDEAERRRQLEDELRDAIHKGQIKVVYQPLVDARTNRVVGLEALSRWEHPDRGMVSPGLFIPIAEEAGLIGMLGDHVLRQACKDAARWPESVRIAVNVSTPQFSASGFTNLVTQALAAAELQPERLEIELTESIFLNESDLTDSVFSSLKMLGVRLALDDFGTGYSSLGYLKNAPFDKIKIDQSFIRGVTEEGSRNKAIIQAIVSMAKALDMDTTAEGIEAQDELALMRELGVKQIQGYIYAHPVSADLVDEAFALGDWMIEPDGPSKYRPERRSVLLRVGLIHEDHRYEVTMRNLSRNGAMVEGLVDVPLGEQFVVDFGEGQLAVAVVRRSIGGSQGLEFEVPLVDDGAGGLCTRHRVSPYVLAQAGMPLAALPPGSYPMQLLQQPGMALSLPRFGQVDQTRIRAIGNG